MRIIPILQQPPQLEASVASSSYYFAFALRQSMASLSWSCCARSGDIIYVPTIAQAESKDLHAANSFVSLAMQSLRRRVNTRTRAPLDLAGVDENYEDEGYDTLPVHDSSARSTKRRRVA